MYQFWFIVFLGFSLNFPIKASETEAADFSGNASFVEVDLVISTTDLNIGGTLLLPKQHHSDALVILSSGSGWQDRNSDLFGFKMFKQIAESLAAQGIASFRYDDRGVGTSTGNFVNSTITDLTNDVHRVISYFSKHSNYDYKEFVLLGHSQGGIVATKAATTNSLVKGVILLATPGVSIGDLVLAQARSEHIGGVANKEAIEDYVSANSQLMRAAQTGKNQKAALKRFKQSYQVLLAADPGNASLSSGEVANRAQQFANEMNTNFALPSLASFLYHNPLPDIEKLAIPVLSIHGGLDQQVPVFPNKDRIETVLLKAEIDYQIKVFEYANHLFQKGRSGQRGEYENLEKKFVDGFLDAISTWMLARN